MANCFYTPNGKLTGGCLFGSWNSKEGHIYFKLLKQIANNPDKKNNFDGKNPINIKLSQDEAADIIRAVRERKEAKFFHKFNSLTTTGNFKYYEIEGEPKRCGFGLSVKKVEDNKEVKISFSLGSAERFSLFLQNALNHIFDAEYSIDKKKYTDAIKNRGEKEQPEEGDTDKGAEERDEF